MATAGDAFFHAHFDRLFAYVRMRVGERECEDVVGDILLRAIEKAKEFPKTDKPNPVIARMRADLGEFAANKFMNAVQQNTISLTTLRSGVGDPPKVNVIPSTAEATLDCRSGEPHTAPDRYRRRLTERAQAEVLLAAKLSATV